MNASPFRLLAALCALLSLLRPSLGLATPPQETNPENVISIDLPAGRVVIHLLPDKAPNHVTRVRELVRRGFYDGLAFHRVIPGFIAQTGDPRGDGSGGSGKTLKAEFSNEPHVRGTVSMARTDDPDSADSQFFICLAPARFLDGNYTVWGRVVSGMEFVDRIRAGSPQTDGAVADPTRIIRMRVASDAGR
ncbi:peptidylprolyl isomerase [Prosthecochloris sp. GSB1]|uniref:peptidylprolyl isomerase n=1 Tax=Prosthecochloris sp. GSB1 TaxID=281093 RepID=UPI000B8D0C2E|nr:peptidylprolyl isomerase [Prosthecochloris sp. GSB1]ASQ91378.1 peptidylprolyl isomerase [Prosthecochloris sp. GSB1]